MIERLAVFSVSLGLIFSISGCVKSNSPVNSDNSYSSNMESQESIDTKSPQSDASPPISFKSSYFTNTMPPLTAEEEKMIDELVSEDILYDFSNYWCFPHDIKDLKNELTYGMLWRYIGNEGMVELRAGNNNHLRRNPEDEIEHFYPRIFPHLKSVNKLFIQLIGSEYYFPIEDVAQMNWLVELEIWGCNVSGGLNEFSESLGKLKELKRFVFSGHSFNELPDVFNGFEKLEFLNLNNNGISILPTSWSGLKKLKTLYLNANPLSNIPDEICRLSNLEVLNLNGAIPITPKGSYVEDPSVLAKTLPENIGDLINLRELSIQFLSIKELPESITYFEKLDRLSILLPLESLPENLEKLSYIENISFIIYESNLDKDENGTLQEEADRRLQIPEDIIERRRMRNG